MGSQQVSSCFRVPWAFCLAFLGVVLVAASLGSQCGLFHEPPGSAQTVANLSFIAPIGSLGQSQVVAELGLHGRPSQEAPEPTHPEASFTPQKNTTQLALQVAQQKGGFGSHWSPLGQILVHGVSSHTVTHVLWA